jgi:hypothetical protein
MQTTSTPPRILKGLFAAVAVVALAVSLASAARAGGVTREQLAAQGWTCVPHPFAAPIWSRCFDPGVGLPFPGMPDRPPTFQYLTFELSSGAFVGTGHMIRGDLYRGQPCGPSGDQYVFLPGIQYYDCSTSH